MSLCVLGMSQEFKDKVAFNCLWPKTLIATAAVAVFFGGENSMKASRKPDVMGDAAHVILTQDHKACTGNFFVDEEVLRKAGVTDLKKY